MSDAALRSALEKLWERSRETALTRVAVLEATAESIAADTLTDGARRQAEREAHRLAGAVGTFGFWSASAMAREIEGLLQSPTGVASGAAPRLRDLARQLRHELEDAKAATEASKAAATPASARVLVISDDVEFRNRLAADSRSLGIEIVTTESPPEARARLRGVVDALLLDLTVAGFGIPFLAELHETHPDLRVIVISDGDHFRDRLQAARLGGRGFLPKPARPSQVIDLLRDSLMVSRVEKPTILVVDDDPDLLALTEALLEPLGARIATLSDPTVVLATLAENAPDLVILDVDMPELDGIELCRVLRNDPRWAAVPVLFLTARIEQATVTRMFECGADDFVAKPVLGPELIARVRNRLERTRMLRLAADVDSLTGIATRRRGIEVLERFFKLAQRQRQPVSIAAIDLDHFKSVNDRFGHSAGDAVLRRAATILAGCFRGEDIVARWGGEEFVVGMFSMPCAAAVRRLEQALAALRDERFESTGDLAVSFSAGVAEFPRDGNDWSTLYRVADDTLARAKAEGRNRVLGASESQSSS